MPYLTRQPTWLVALTLTLGGAAAPSLAQEGDAAMAGSEITFEGSALADQTPAIVTAAEAFLATLSDEQQDAAQFDWNDDTQRHNWSNFPLGGPGVNRQGVKWGDLDAEQRAALVNLLGTLLSSDGLKMVQEQMAADDIVAANDDGGGPPGAPPDEGQATDGEAPPAGTEPDQASAVDQAQANDQGNAQTADASQSDAGAPPQGERPPVSFGSAYYFVSFVGEPSETEPFMIQFGGHHLAINATVAGPHVTLSPTLTGGQPLRFVLNGRPVYIVEEEAVQAAQLLASFDETQRQGAVVSDERADLVLGPGHDGEVLQPEGIAGADMDVQQRAQFLELIEGRLGILNADDLAAVMAPIAENLDQTTFAWFGPTEPLGAAYWRVVGPTVILEFAPQSNDGDPTDHAHNIYRDPTNEYGAAWAAVP